MAVTDIPSVGPPWNRTVHTARSTLTSGLKGALLFVVAVYVFLELRMWFWGIESTRGTFVPRANILTYQTAKTICLLLVLAVAVRLQVWSVLMRIPLTLLLLLWAGLTIVWSGQVMASLQQYVLILGALFSAAILARSFKALQQITFMGNVMAAALIVCLLYTFLIPSVGLMGGRHEGALRGMLLHKNHFGAFAAFAFCFMFALRQITGAQRYTWLMWASAICVVLSDSASAVLMLVIAVLTLGLARVSLHGSRRARQVVIGVTVLTIPFLLLGIGTFWSDLLSLLGRDASLTSRTGIWSVVADYLVENPNIFFLGSGPSGAVAPELVAQMQLLSGYRGVGTTHSAYLDILINYGVVGLLLFLAITLGAIITSVRLYIGDKDPTVRIASLLVGQIIILTLVRSVITSEAGLTASFPLLMLMTALLTLVSIKKGRAL